MYVKRLLQQLDDEYRTVITVINENEEKQQAKKAAQQTTIVIKQLNDEDKATLEDTRRHVNYSKFTG